MEPSTANAMQVYGGLLMTPMMYHYYMGTNTLENRNVRFCTILGLGILTLTLIPPPPAIKAGDTSTQMIITTLSYCAKAAFITGVGVSLMHYVQ
jgi:hypothetical protein